MQTPTSAVQVNLSRKYDLTTTTTIHTHKKYIFSCKALNHYTPKTVNLQAGVRIMKGEENIPNVCCTRHVYLPLTESCTS